MWPWECILRDKTRLAKQSFAGAVDSGKGGGVEPLVRVEDGGVERTARLGEEDILITCMDGLTGFPEGVVPPTCVQMGIVAMLGNSPKYVSYQELKKVCTDLQGHYPAAAEAADREALEALGKTWEAK
jgi:hypothetical protein